MSDETEQGEYSTIADAQAVQQFRDSPAGQGVVKRALLECYDAWRKSASPAERESAWARHEAVHAFVRSMDISVDNGEIAKQNIAVRERKEKHVAPGRKL